MDDASDEDLIARAIDGDGGAFARLVERHYSAIYRTAWRWCGSREDAEDIAQEVCVKLGQAIRGFSGGAAFSTWLYRVTLNAVRDFARAKARRQRHVTAFVEMADTATPPAAPDSEDALWQAVRQLPEKQRDAVLLVYAEEKSHAEAANVMGCAETTVSWHIHAAKKRLKGLLQEQMS